MAETSGRHTLSLAETHGLRDDSILNAIHQRWLECTAQGDGRLIMLSFAQQMSSGAPDIDTSMALFDGYIARVGAEQVQASETRSEYATYLVGRQAVRSLIESNPDEVTIRTIIDAIKAAYNRDDGPDEAVGETQNGNGRPVLQPPTSPRIRRVKRKHERSSKSQTADARRLASLTTANQQKSQLAGIRAGLRKGTIGLAEALSNSDIERVTIGDILMRIPHVGKVKRGAALKTVEVAEETEIGTLTEKEKTQLAEMFPKEKYQPSTCRMSTEANREQAMKSLRKAEEARIYRAGLKRKLATGEMTVEELFDDPVGAGMKLRELLLKLPTRTGANPRNVRSNRLLEMILSETSLPGSRPCNCLTGRQRKLLLDRLAVRYKPNTRTYTTAAKL